MPIKPPRLNPGDTIGIIAPASAPPDPKAIERAVEVVEKLGFQPRLAPNVRKRWGFLAGSDRERASDLMKMFSARDVKGILCVRGGYGAARLLPLLDYQTIRRDPKVFIGYSDITSLHCAFLVKSDLVSFHGPMLNSDLNKEDCPRFTVESLLKSVMQATPAGSLRDGSKSKDARVIRRGTASGPLIGGNLCLLCTTLGTPYQPSFRGKILFFEDLEEAPFRFDRMLTHLLNAGVLQQVVGVAVGVNKDCHDPNAKKTKEYRQTLEDVLAERLLPLKVPIVSGLPFGHVPVNATLPIGIRATLDGNRGDLLITESGVR
jgi:muramoyltetrapeptide carboxypeptidase